MQTHCADDNSYKKYCVHSIPNSTFCEPVVIDELIHLIGNLNNNKGAGPDNILATSAKGNVVCHHTTIFIHYKPVLIYWYST